MQTTGLHHIVLNVSDLERSRHFYADILGFEVRSLPTDFPHPVFAGCHFFMVGPVEVFLVCHQQNQPADRFSEFRVGLDHLSFPAPSEEALHAFAEHLKANGVETKGVETFLNSTPYVSFRDPDNIQLEYWLHKADG